jgi:hypothetical protein
MAEAASISYGNEFSSEPRKSPLDKHIPESSKVRKTHHPWRGLFLFQLLVPTAGKLRILAISPKLRLKEGLSAQLDPPGGILSAELWVLSLKKLRR